MPWIDNNFSFPMETGNISWSYFLILCFFNKLYDSNKDCNDNRFDIFSTIISDKELNIKMTARRLIDDDNNEPSII